MIYKQKDTDNEIKNNKKADYTEWQVRFSRNLENIRKESGKSIVEFSEELGIPKSIMQPILKTGNTTLNTAVSIASVLDVSLDELIRGEDAFEQTRFITLAGQMLEKFDRLDAEEQELILHHINEIFGIVRKK